MISLTWKVRFCTVLVTFVQDSGVRSSVSCPALCQAHRRLLQLPMRGNEKPKESNGSINSEEIDVKGDFQGKIYWFS